MCRWLPHLFLSTCSKWTGREPLLLSLRKPLASRSGLGFVGLCHARKGNDPETRAYLVHQALLVGRRGEKSKTSNAERKQYISAQTDKWHVNKAHSRSVARMVALPIGRPADGTPLRSTQLRGALTTSHCPTTQAKMGDVWT